jgi:serine/threonine protein phosphatase 1
MVAVIGDIHGCYFTLIGLLEKIWAKYPQINVYSVGDLVDRGKFSFEVVQYFKNKKMKFCLGNHDLMFLHYIQNVNPLLALNWKRNGCESTLESYQNHNKEINKHVKCFLKAPLYFNLRDCFISHAGISIKHKAILGDKFRIGSPEFNAVIQGSIIDNSGILWTRDELMNIGKLQVVGHSRKKQITVNTKSNSVYIDTSAFTGNGLTGVIIEKSEIVEILFEQTRLDDM